MRVLVATTAGSGHFGPLVPFARACAAAGHEVGVAAPLSFAAEVTGAGFEHLPFADVPPELMGRVYGRLPTMTDRRTWGWSRSGGGPRQGLDQSSGP